MKNIFVFDPTKNDRLSAVRGVGRYLQILKENFPNWKYIGINQIKEINHKESIFINPFFNFLSFPLILKRITNKQIAVIHDLIPLKYPSHFPTGIKGKINIYLNKFALKNYDLVITDSGASKKDIIELLKYPENKIKVIYPCLPKSFLKIKKNDFNNNQVNINKFVLYVGDATWNKNLVNLAKAIKIINVTCVFVGKVFDEKSFEQSNLSNNKWLNEYKEFIKETKNDKRFIFKGYLSDEELINLYKKATLNVLPSYDEGFGFSYLEASQFSCPSVLSDILVLKEISDGDAIFSDPNNPNDLADKIGELYFNKEINKTYSDIAKKRSKYFSQSQFQKDFLHYL